MMISKVCSFIILAYSAFVQSAIVNFERIGGIPHNTSYEVAFANGQLFNDTLNKLQPFDVFIIPNRTFTMVGGIIVEVGLSDVVIQIDGTISFTNDRETWPKNANGDVEECIYMSNLSNVTFTSSGTGTLDGNGQEWWGAIKFLVHQEDRPRLLHIYNTKDILVENLLFKDSPYWTFYAEKSNGLVIRKTDVVARWTPLDGHSLVDLQAFNTDGFDVTGTNVHIYDSNIWNQDDCISVKDGSSNMLFERIACSGLGLVIGSIGSSVVNNITFRDCTMHKTVKGIYMKTRWSDKSPATDYSASITNILYENITMDAPQQYGIWIGPAQQTGQPCSLLWTITPHAECIMSGYQMWENITLRDITINNPDGSPGVLLGNASNPMRNVVFENVVVNNPGMKPWGLDFYDCEGIEGYALGTTSPVPPCFKSIKTN
eukprot:gene6617-9084_t